MSEKLSVDAGLALIAREVRPIGIETVPIATAIGRVTADTVIARRTVPSFRAAAMDGFIVRSSDTIIAKPGEKLLLPVTGSVAAGEWPFPLPNGEAWKISTGAPVPTGGDSVIMIEHALLQTDGPHTKLEVADVVASGLNIRQIGEDILADQPALGMGAVVTPDIIAGLAAYGVDTIAVYRAPSIAVLITGRELDAVAAQGRSTIVDSNGPMICASARSLSASIASIETVDDHPLTIDVALDRACETDCDIIISSGGASHGEHDGIVGALARRGAAILFHGLAMRPGKPIIFAVLADGRPFFGLPGNPVSACVAMRFFVTAAIRCMLGLPREQGISVDSFEEGKPGVSVFLRGRLYQKPDGQFGINTKFDQRSHVLSSLMAANSWLHITGFEGSYRRIAFPKAASLAEFAC